MLMDDVRVVALIPAWNEAARIGPVVAAVSAYVDVLVVDDGSEDDTLAVARDAGAAVVRHAHNQGKGRALMTGFAWALERGYDGVLTLDADGQHDPEDAAAFLAAYAAVGADLIIGRRDFRQMPFPRSWSNPFGSWLLSRVLGSAIHDNQSGYRLYSRRLLEGLDATSSGFEWEVEVIVDAVRRGLRIDWVDIRTIYGIDKVSYFHPIRDSARFLRTVWRAWRRRRDPSVRG
jgi:glycosyltransferase involved in cell wall biosynthesis